MIALLPAMLVDWRWPGELFTFLRAALDRDKDIYSAFIGFRDGGFVQALSYVDSQGDRRASDAVPDDAVEATRVAEDLLQEGARPQTWQYFDVKGAEIEAEENAGTTRSTYDPRSRSWYKAAQEWLSASYSDVYIFSSLRKPGITISAPMRNVEGAVAGVDIPLNHLTEFTRLNAPGEHGLIAIVQSDGQLIAYPDSRALFRPVDGALVVNKVDDLEDTRVKTAMRLAAERGRPSVRFRIGPEEYLAVVTSMQGLGAQSWKVVVVAALSDFSGPIRKSMKNSMIYTGLIMLVPIVVVLVLSNWIAAPVRAVRDQADRIRELELSERVSVRSPFTEIKSLETAMEGMRAALSTFLKYVPKDLVRRLVESGIGAEIGGTRQDVAVLFTDVESFTTLTEDMTPEAVLSQTSRYFDVMTSTIQSHNGVVDKFIGDAIMALWNAPSPDPNYVDNACRAALAALRASEDLNRAFEAQGEHPLRTRFGLHVGDALVGNVGSAERMQFTALGPNVNLASRIEGLNKYYGTQLLVSDAIRKQASPGFVFRQIDVVEAAGTTKSVAIHELVGMRDAGSPFAVPPATIEAINAYEVALKACLAREFEDALGLVEEVLMENPADHAALMLAERCNRYIAHPPPDDWDGVSYFSDK